MGECFILKTKITYIVMLKMLLTLKQLPAFATLKSGQDSRLMIMAQSNRPVFTLHLHSMTRMQVGYHITDAILQIFNPRKPHAYTVLQLIPNDSMQSCHLLFITFVNKHRNPALQLHSCEVTTRNLRTKGPRLAQRHLAHPKPKRYFPY